MEKIKTKIAMDSRWLGGMMPRAMPKIKRAIRIEGKESWTSAMRMMMVSVSPPR